MLTPILGLYRSPNNYLHRNPFYYLNNTDFKLSDKVLVLTKDQWEFNKNKLINLNNKIVILTTDINYFCYSNNVNVIYNLDWLLSSYCELIFLDIDYNGIEILDVCRCVELLDTIDIFQSDKMFENDLIDFVLSSSSEIKIDRLTGLDYYSSIYVKK